MDRRRGGNTCTRLTDRIPFCFASFKINIGQVTAVIEGIRGNRCNARGNGETRQTGARTERICSDTCYTRRNHKVTQKLAVQIQIVRGIQRIRKRICKTNRAPCRKVGDLYARQAAATRERRTANARDTRGDRYGRQAAATGKCLTINHGNAVAEGQLDQAGAIAERIHTNRLDVSGNHKGR